MRDCYIKTKSGKEKARFIGVFQRSKVVDASPMIGGHPGGVIAYPCAVVIEENGRMSEHPVFAVSFDVAKEEQSP